MHGMRILGPRGAIPALVARFRADQVLLAIPSATSELVRDVATLCEEADVPLRVLPSVREVVGGRITARDIRDLRIEDLLGRQQVQTDLQAVAGILQGRRVMVTGAGGSIGSEIARQVWGYAPSALLLLDHDETLLHDVQAELPSDAPVVPVLADIRDRERLLGAFARYRPDVVFHAAAHKHVPILETHPEEAVQTNVMGAANVAEAAVMAGVERMVLISTDKAVNPVSIMGISKWFAERIVLSLQGIGSRLCVVRFGNVLGSRGSVIPTFLRQIASGGPLTVTDPAMARYFMSVHEAVQLVLQAAALSTGGEVFTLDMGEPVNIMGLARKLIRLSGRVPERDVPIVVVGSRPGEKLIEEIVAPDEESVASQHPAIVVSRPPAPDRAALRRAMRDLEVLARDGNSEDLAERLRSLGRYGLQAAMAQEGS
jgi:FlaA1/EpsC-like NDP-sugar epimerase